MRAASILTLALLFNLALRAWGLMLLLGQVHFYFHTSWHISYAQSVVLAALYTLTTEGAADKSTTP